MAGVLYLVATPIGNLDDMTYRAVKVLGDVDIVAAEDTRTARKLFDHFSIDHRDVRSFFAGNEASRTEELVAELAAGKNVAVISEAGTPGVSDPGHRLARAAASAELQVVAVPGASAVLTALVGSGLPTGEFRFIGFPPRQAGARQQLFGQLAGDTATLVFYESPRRLAQTLADAASAFGPRQAVVCRELTKLYEEYVRGELGDLAARYQGQPPRGECSVVVAGASGDSAPVDIEAEVTALLGQGLGPKDVSRRLVVKTGRSRRELYQLALSLAEDNKKAP